MLSADMEDSMVTTPVFYKYVQQISAAVLDDDSSIIQQTLATQSDLAIICSKFISDNQTNCLYIEKILVESDQEIQPESFEYRIALELDPSPRVHSVAALIKKQPILESSKSLASQIQMIMLPGFGDTTSPYSSLLSYLQNAVSPYFDVYSSKIKKTADSDRRDDKDGKSGISMTKKKIAELELSLMYLQQNTEIPQVTLSIHPLISNAVEKAHSIGRKAAIESLGHLDSSLLNRLQSDVNSWIKEIQKVTKLNREVSSGTASQEINFWLGMESAISQIEIQLAREEVVLTLEALKAAKRFHATVSFLADTGLKECSDVTIKYNQLMRDFPISELLSATDMEKIKEGVNAVFSHLNKKLRLCPYPVRRALQLVEAISTDFKDQLLKLFSDQRLMRLEYQEFQSILESCENSFSVWDENIKEFTSIAREATRKRAEKFIPIKVNSSHLPLKEKLEYVKNFRERHETLYASVAQVLESEILAPGASDSKQLATIEASSLQDIQKAFETFKNLDVLDTSPAGNDQWTAAEKSYMQKISQVENQIIVHLRDRLASAKNATEMFKIFSKFNSLFVRPKIRGAIQEYQTQLIDNVKQDIRSLQDTFKAGFQNSDASKLSLVRGLPPVSSSILWAKQMERQLNLSMKRIEDVLGTGWEYYSEGEKLKIESNAFRKKLDTSAIFENWLSEFSVNQVQITGCIFEIKPNKALGNLLQISVKFNAKAIELFKEVKSLLYMNFSVPHTIASLAKDAKRVYPFASALSSSLNLYNSSLDRLESFAEIKPLVAGYHRDAQAVIAKGIPLKWDYFVGLDLRPDGLKESRHALFVKEFASCISIFNSKVEAAIQIYGNIKNCIEQLETCDFNIISSLIEQIQNDIDTLNLESFSNLEYWTSELDSQLSKTLLTRAVHAIENWIVSFENQVLGTSADEFDGPKFQKFTHLIKVRNQVMYVEPTIENSRCHWLNSLHDYVSVVFKQKRLDSTRFSMSQNEEVFENATYKNLIDSVPEELISRAYRTIENCIELVNSYTMDWFKYQALWDLSIDHVLQLTGTDLQKWQQLMLEIKKARATVDTFEINFKFGQVLLVDYSQIQQSVISKYDQWQREILNRFALEASIQFKDLSKILRKARSDTEQLSTDISNMKSLNSLVTFVSEIKVNLNDWSESVDLFQSVQKLLERQRYQFPREWTFADQLVGECSALTEIVERKQQFIQENNSAIQRNIEINLQLLEKKIEELLQNWATDKPVAGQLNPAIALNVLSEYQERIKTASADLEIIQKTRKVLGLEVSSTNSQLELCNEQVDDLKLVWINLQSIWSCFDEIKAKLWSQVNSKQLKEQLQSLIYELERLPLPLQSYAAYEQIWNSVKQAIDYSAVLSDLGSECFKDRHWLKLFKKSKQDYIPISQLSFGHVLGLNLEKNEQFIKTVLVTAQGEMALEEFLRQVKDQWSEYTVDLVNYQNKCRLIRGWDDIFSKSSDHISAFQSMKHSPYYKVFEQESSNWEDKVNRIHLIFDCWVEVQRNWVYLEGVFDNSDLKQVMPTEALKFASVDSEFMNLMKKVYKSPLVIDILNIPNCLNSLERLSETLLKLKKSLGDYLEKERLHYPRFYFLGDEDLLEILGNSQEISRIEKHLQKMFAGIARFKSENGVISGVFSKENEFLEFSKQIHIHAKVKQLLELIESETRLTLARSLESAVKELESVWTNFEPETFLKWTRFPAQVTVCALQIVWTEFTEKTIDKPSLVSKVVDNLLESLCDFIKKEIDSLQRRKLQNLITELVHKQQIVKNLDCKNVSDFGWQKNMRFYLSEKENLLERFTVRMADAQFVYGYEYLGVQDHLVQTPLTDQCYLTLTQALKCRMGGSPFGPAGTGKTESTKALGHQLGRFVVVFCCDEAFDLQAIGRILTGLSQVGAWGCFDEFNRLNERTLSAVSQQIHLINTALKANQETVFLKKSLRIHPWTGIFITMNPGYAGRSDLPDNLKKLFRSVSMSEPDKLLIAQVMLYSQGFKHAKMLASKLIPLFDLCKEQLSLQSHYDFGLRALKSVLMNAGEMKRSFSGESDEMAEKKLVYQSILSCVLPKLVSKDDELLLKLLEQIFTNVTDKSDEHLSLLNAIKKVCVQDKLVYTEQWASKLIQLYNVQNNHHGFMIVGNGGTGKTAAWKTLLKAMEHSTSIESTYYIIDPKSISKETLYGHLDQTTREWTDGVVTSILRKIRDNLRGEEKKRHWIVFDGDVDAVWIENMNSLLDDNKVLTLPNGERLNLLNNVRLVFEVDSLKHATLATVSRCGMIWFSEQLVNESMIYSRYCNCLPSGNVEDCMKGLLDVAGQSILGKCFEFELSSHVMNANKCRQLNSFFALIEKAILNVNEFNISRPEFALSRDHTEKYFIKYIMYALFWAFAGDCNHDDRQKFSDFLVQQFSLHFSFYEQTVNMADYYPDLKSANWKAWNSMVPSLEIEPQRVLDPTLVIPTVDTVRHEDTIYSWLSNRKPLILCGPPGTGKSMTLFSSLRKLGDCVLATMNFSSGTDPELLLKTLEQYASIRKTSQGLVMSPKQQGQWLILFCDEINLPSPDHYGTQRVISLLRQMIEQKGFWTTNGWVEIDHIQFVGACNPPTDAGRVEMSSRFMSWCPVLLVDYPTKDSLVQIYSCLFRAILKMVPHLRGYAEPLTEASCHFYSRSKEMFTPDQQAHYIYSPREMSRWIRGIHDKLLDLQYSCSLEILIRIWAHEALRLFQDRLVTSSERELTDRLLNETADTYFPGTNHALERPILFSKWLTRGWQSVDAKELSEYLTNRLSVFSEEEFQAPIVLYDDLLDHCLRIDRVLNQYQGHLLLMGISGSGKTSITKFVSWLNGYSVYEIRPHKKYGSLDFDEDLKKIIKRVTIKNEKLVFLLDESQLADPMFIERMNTLLANAEIPGLFEQEEEHALFSQLKETAAKEGLDMHSYFVKQISRNLHVVLTMNPADLSEKATSSPALFNRCVLNWFGDWSVNALHQVAAASISKVDVEFSKFSGVTSNLQCYSSKCPRWNEQSLIINALLMIHETIKKSKIVTPRHFTLTLEHFCRLLQEKRGDLEEQQLHMNIGLSKLKETFETVGDLKTSLAQKKAQLEQKNVLANEKLLVMVRDQQQAEQQKEISLKIQSQIDEQQQLIEKRKQLVLDDLSLAEPAVVQAKASVREIKKQHLTEVRSMSNPPDAVKYTMESVCILLGFKVESWKQVQSVIRKDDFISSVVNYDTSQLTASILKTIKQEYLTNSSFTFEVVDRASKACGPLFLWVSAQVQYADILEKIGPLRAQVAVLEKEATETKQRASAIQVKIKQLEDNIGFLKAEYAVLIKETEALKSEMNKVKSKVDRSEALLTNLSLEQERWSNSSNDFAIQMETIIGNVLIASVFLGYLGYCNQQQRLEILNLLKTHLKESGIKYTKDLDIASLLASPDQRVEWTSNGLATDDYSMQNACFLQNSSSWPLFIDPTGNLLHFLKKQYKNLQITSFLDENFVKVLENALRFGNCLLVQDAHVWNNVIDSIVSREFIKKGGRNLVKVGSADVDVAPGFNLILFTRQSLNFSVRLSSRVSLVSFEITEFSLSLSLLHSIINLLRPDIEQKRIDLLRMQGDYQVRLRTLEKQLLNTLNQSENLLKDDLVIAELEHIKEQASSLEKKIKDSDLVMQEIVKVTSEYEPIADFTSRIYFIMQSLSQLQSYYQFSLDFFTSCFNKVLEDKELNATRVYSQRKEILETRIFKTFYSQVSVGLMHQDKLKFGLLLCLLKLENMQIPSKLITSLFSSELQGFENVTQSSGWKEFTNSTLAETMVPIVWQSESNEIDLLKRLILVKAYRPDRLVPALTEFISQILKTDFDAEFESVCESPVLLYGLSGSDPSQFVDRFSNSSNVSVALGSLESEREAYQSLKSSQNSTVVLKNIHLAPEFMDQLQHMLTSNTIRRKLVLTMELKGTSNSLVKNCRKVIVENPPGLKAKLVKNLHSLTNRSPNASLANKLLFAVCWLHAVILERARYAPFGFSKSYEFGELEFELAIQTVLDSLKVRLDFVLIECLLLDTIYGVKMDTDQDKQVVASIIRQIFNDKIQLPTFELVESQLKMPNANSIAEYIEWTNQLPDLQPPHWIGLPNDIEKHVMQKNAEMIIEQSNQIITNTIKTSEPQLAVIGNWLKQLPDKINLDFGTGIVNQCLIRQYSRLNQLVVLVKRDLLELHAVITQKQAHSNNSRNLNKHLTENNVPSNWGTGLLTNFISDLISKANYQPDKVVNLGKLPDPVAFITASRQETSEKSKVSLENLHLKLSFNGNGQKVQGLTLIGAEMNESLVKFTDSLKFNLGLMSIEWTTESQEQVVPVYMDCSRTRVLFYGNLIQKVDQDQLATRAVAYVLNSE